MSHARRIVSWFLLGAALLVGCTSTKKPERRAGTLPAVELDGTWFLRNGKRFVPVGAHWVPAKAAMHWPLRWDPADIEADFAKMHDLGYTLVRFDVLWAFLEPRPGQYNPEAFRRDRFSCLARAQVRAVSAPEPLHRR